MPNLTELKIYLTPYNLILTDNRGFRVECNVPTLGNFVAITVGDQTFYFENYPPIPPMSPSAGSPVSDTSSDQYSAAPGGNGGPQDPIHI